MSIGFLILVAFAIFLIIGQIYIILTHDKQCKHEWITEHNVTTRDNIHFEEECEKCRCCGEIRKQTVEIKW